jgi:hypothetical protein
MQKEYGTKELAAISVSLDDPSESGATDKALRFLKATNATFTNLILDEKPSFWQKKLGFEGPPGVFIYDRDGTLQKQFANAEVNYDEIEKLVKKLLDKK